MNIRDHAAILCGRFNDQPEKLSHREAMLILGVFHDEIIEDCAAYIEKELSLKYASVAQEIRRVLKNNYTASHFGSAEDYGISIKAYIPSTDGFLPIGTDRAPSYKYWFIETLDHTRWEKYKTRCIYLAGIDTHEHSVQLRMEELSREWNVRLKEIHRDEISPEEYTSL